MNMLFQFGAYESQPEGFDEVGIHSETDTIFDPDSYDVEGYNERDFNRDGINRSTDISFDLDGFDINGKRC